jgi:putative membrane-bound dehydrogenase-like protein
MTNRPRLLFCPLASCLVSLWIYATVVGQEPLGVRVPPGFEVTLFADDDLAHDIHSMMLDSKGRVVVSAPGYVRILLDRDGDGKADAFQQFADGPKSGAQGMCFDGSDLLCTGDAGLIRYRDRNGDGKADGLPETLLPIKTGGEHTAHAIQRGPDGWWYLIAGNHSGVSPLPGAAADEKMAARYASLRTSPICRPQAGVLLRLPPDFSGCEIVADGFRNAYDFAFNAQGDLFAYDSDGEREVTLPWYQPTRVFHVLAGSSAGWVSESWKKPDYFPDMPPVVASLGRGSPTGVTCYRHHQFPPKYDGALLVCDWTFGRIVALPLVRDGETWTSKPLDFMTGLGTFGFAPTDIEVAPDGSLFVSVGGRGTRGGVYRVTYKKNRQERETENTSKKSGDKSPHSTELAACLDAPQPLSAWSRARWLPLAKKLGPDTLRQAALDADRPAAQRIRAIEILGELFPKNDIGRELASDKSTEVRARAAWASGHQPTVRDAKNWLQYALDDDPLVQRVALEALLHLTSHADLEPFLNGLGRGLESPRRFVRHVASQVVAHCFRQDLDAVELHLNRRVYTAPETSMPYVWMHLGYAARPTIIRSLPIHQGLDLAAMTKYRVAPELRLTAVRLLQIALGDVGPGKHAAVFDGYMPRLALRREETISPQDRKLLAAMFPRDHRSLDIELSRLLAMLVLDDAELLDRLLAKISTDSYPTDDVHYLIVAARNVCRRSAAQREAIAKALVQLDGKIEKLHLPRESTWDARIAELYAELVRLDPELPAAVVRQSGFGRPDHVMFTAGLGKELLPRALAAFAAAVERDREYPWTPELVSLLGRSQDTKHVELVRKQFQRFSVRGAVLLVLARHAEQRDRAKFVTGLEAAELEVLSASVDALAKLPATREADEQVALVRTLRRLGSESREYPLRERVARLLQRNLNQDFGFKFGKEGYRPQGEAISKWTEFIIQQYPRAAAQAFGGGTDWQSVLRKVDWSQGDATRGAKLFEVRACSRCHSGRTALGPDLAGVARRFSREDLFTAIADPHRDVSPRYQTTAIQTTDGKTYSGLVIYEALDGVTLRDALNQTIRIDGKLIEHRRTLSTSLMPTGLLNDLKPADLADLYAYLQTLGVR